MREVFHKVRYTPEPLPGTDEAVLELVAEGLVMSADKRFPDWVRHSGVGLELAGAVAGFALVGYWIDLHFSTSPWGLVVGVVLGIVGGLYNFVREALQATREAQREDRDGK